MSRTIALGLALIASLVASSAVARTLRNTFGDRYRAAPGTHATPITRPRDAAAVGEWLQHWNQIAIDASGLDHTPVAPGETRVFGEQLGPGRASRAMAIVHIAIFEAVNAIAGATAAMPTWARSAWIVALPRRPPSRRRRTTRWSRSFPRRRRASTRSSPKT